MPDRDVKTILDVINFQYAKIITCSAFNCRNGKEAKKNYYGFIKKTFKDLQSGKKSWSDIDREDWQLVESEKCCVYCGSTENLAREHIIPKSLKINERCCGCDTIQAIHNQVWACRSCNSEKGVMGLYTFFKKRLPGEVKFYDLIPPLAEKKYLKTVYCCLSNCTSDVLELGDFDGDGEMTVLDIDFVLKTFGKLAGK
jgi:5-methylcytosine-specific restriction endonuclease McrA